MTSILDEDKVSITGTASLSFRHPIDPMAYVRGDPETRGERRALVHDSNDALIISENVQNELKAGVVELVLDGLCWVEPKILDKKEGTYVAI